MWQYRRAPSAKSTDEKEKSKKLKQLNFQKCIEYLENEGYTTTPMKPWVKRIKDHGNKAAQPALL